MATCYRCGHCGTVHQPGLPGGEQLADLYRAMSDDAYLSEEAGPARDRRPPARPDRAACRRRAPARRGLRPRPAARRGAPPRLHGPGLELSHAAAAYARDVLELDVREEQWRTSPRREGGFQVIVLADVIEHLDDPLRRSTVRARCSRRAARSAWSRPTRRRSPRRLAGPRWWGYIPAHTYLFPRRTLRELLEARGLVHLRGRPARALVRAPLLARRPGRAQRAAGALAGASARTPLGRRLSLSLGDERVMLAHKVAVSAGPAPAHGRPRRRLQRARGASRLPRRGDDPAVAREMPVRVRRPCAARGRREPRRHLRGRAAGGLRRAAPPRQPRLRRQPEDLLRPRHPRRRRRGRDGPRRQPVRPGAGRPDGQADRRRASPTW